MNKIFLVFFLIFAFPTYSVNAQIRPGTYCNGEFYLIVKKENRIAFVLPQTSGLGPFAIVGEGAYKSLKKGRIYDVTLEYGYNPPLKSRYIFETLGKISPDSTEIKIDTTEFGDIGALQVSYFDSESRKYHRFRSNRIGVLQLRWYGPVFSEVVNVSTFGIGYVRIPIDSLMGRSIRVRFKDSECVSKVYLGSPLFKEKLTLIISNPSDSINLSFLKNGASITLYRCKDM